MSRARRELANTLSRVEALLDAIPDLMFRVDKAGTYLHSHSIDPTELYAPSEAFLGKTITEVLPPAIARPAMAHLVKAIATGEPQIFEYRLEIQEDLVDYEARIVSVPDANEAIIIVRDISDTKTVERGLRSTIESKTEFLASVSHALRTPLTAVLGYAYLLSSSDESVQPDQRDQMTAELIEQTNVMTDIVQDLLVAARAEIGGISVVEVPVDLNSQATRLLETYSNIQARIKSPPPPPNDPIALADPERVEQIIRNLVSNADQHGGDSIEIETFRHNGSAHLRVIDDGPGIATEKNSIFDPYTDHPIPGLPGRLGIGLSVSRHLARLMGGDLNYQREDGKTVLELALPSAKT